ncbi:hypothetical protein [Tuberibacillus sp. Marseille-P3662]|uniref:hypothetical protein n=1 Tax=Tuberibacillus sp. Marseille-P3662 TaxID=1965358 RepID=UPI000A1C99C3|nr:hypothetical protein [Tuberibacillus sp. Marseille-P3662]
MGASVYQLLVESIMNRMPSREEDPGDFFIGFDRLDHPYLLLPTPIRLLPQNEVFTVRFVCDPLNKFRYTLDHHFTKVSYTNLVNYHNDKAFFFGPEDNMLKQFLQSDMYQTYVEWLEHLHTDLSSWV